MKDEERAILQRRIKNQRAALRRLNRHVITLNSVSHIYLLESMNKKSSTYRHASQIAESFWFGHRIAQAIRRWM